MSSNDDHRYVHVRTQSCPTRRSSDLGNYSAPSHVHFHNYRRLHSASYYLSMIEQGVGRQSMLIRNFIPGEETELRRVFMSSVHGLARVFYTPEQDRKSVVSGKSVSVRVGFGGSRFITKINTAEPISTI